MWKRPLLAAAILHLGLLVHAAPVLAVNVTAQLFPFTGEVRLLNRGTSPIPFVYYSITSAGGALDGNNQVWQSIAENYDVSGNGLIDSSNEWFVLADDPDELTEAVFSGPGGSLPATRAISLGNIWDPFAVPFPDLVFDIQNDTQSIPVTVELAIDGDYSSNQVVDQADYVLWRKYLNSVSVLLADGDLNGVVDANDYSLWRANIGRSVPLPPYGIGSGASSPPLAAAAGVVPEPATGALALLAIAWFAMVARVARWRHIVDGNYWTRCNTAC